MRKHVPALALCVLSLGPVLTARAADAPVAYRPCDRKPSDADTKAAKGLFQAGRVSYEEGDYNKAILLWRDAYDRDCTAVLLLSNLANAYEKAGNIEAAIVTLDAYIKRDPDNPEIPTLQKRIENMRRARASAPPATTSAPAATAAPKPTTTAPVPPPTETAPPSTGSRPLTPLFVAGGGAVVGIAGLVVYLTGVSKYNDAGDRVNAAAKASGVSGKGICDNAQLNADGKSACSDGDSARSQRTIGAVLSYGGLGIAAAGGIWYLLSKPEPSSSGRYILPSLSPGYGGVSFGGKF